MTQRPPRTFAARPKKLLSGDWGANIETADQVLPGDYVNLESKAGKRWTMRVGEVHRPSKFGVAVATERLAPGEVAPDVEEAKATEAESFDESTAPF